MPKVPKTSRTLRQWPVAPSDAPPRPKESDTWCNCNARCNGGKWVSRSTRTTHLPSGAVSEPPEPLQPGPSTEAQQDEDVGDNDLLMGIMYREGQNIQGALGANRTPSPVDNVPDYEHGIYVASPSGHASPKHPSEPSSPLPHDAIDVDLSPSSDEELAHESPPDQPIPTLESLLNATRFVELVRNASLADKYSALSPDDIENIRNPITEPVVIDDEDFRLSLDTFLACQKSSEATYASMRAAILRRYPDSKMLSYDQILLRVKRLSGVVPLIHDMCINSCMAYTGIHIDLKHCTRCSEPRYISSARQDDPDSSSEPEDGDEDTLPSRMRRGKPRRQYATIPPTMQLQAGYRDPRMSGLLSYGWRRACAARDELEADGKIENYDDVQCGRDYQIPLTTGKLKPRDGVYIFSIDGCQLFENKDSNAWIGMLVNANLDPAVRYLKSHVDPVITIAGTPKDMDSFLFPLLHHFSALCNDEVGLRVWDSRDDTIYRSDPYLLYGTADTKGLIDLNGWVGHNGRFGCRFLCGFAGRHKFQGPTYYPVLLKPDNCDRIVNTNHDDYDINNLPKPSAQLYQTNLTTVLSSKSNAVFKRNRLLTGICKPSIFSGLSRATVMPFLNPSDSMHRNDINLPALFISLWTGTMEHSPADDPSTWPWAVLVGDDYASHGKDVEKWGKKLPRYVVGSRPPRNPVEKMNSGYKAVEFHAWLFYLGPGLLFPRLPRDYWKHWCKIVFGTSVSEAYDIHCKWLPLGHQKLLEAVLEFEVLYYERRLDRLHFVRQCLHALTHAVPEVSQVGCPRGVAQWTMERLIGNLEEEIRLHSNPYANLSERAILRAQVNTLASVIPDLRVGGGNLNASPPQYSVDLGDDFHLLRARDDTKMSVSESHSTAILDYAAIRGVDTSEMVADDVTVQRWAGLLLPNKQRVRTKWKEEMREKDNYIQRYIKLDYKGFQRYGEVHYFFQSAFHDDEDDETLAMITLFTPIDTHLYDESSWMLRVVNTSDTHKDVVA